MKITTDLIIAAARVTRAVYYENAHKLVNHPASSIDEMRRMAIMDALANDDNLCEMLAGRIHQLGQGTPAKKGPTK